MKGQRIGSKDPSGCGAAGDALDIDIGTRRREELFTAAAIGLVLLTSMLNGLVAAGLALGLLIVGLVLFPQTRRVGVAVAVAAAVVAAALTFISR